MKERKCEGRKMRRRGKRKGKKRKKRTFLPSLLFFSFFLHRSFSHFTAHVQLHTTSATETVHRPKDKIVGDMYRLSCEPRGIPQKRLQIACVVAIYVIDVICK